MNTMHTQEGQGNLIRTWYHEIPKKPDEYRIMLRFSTMSINFRKSSSNDVDHNKYLSDLQRRSTVYRFLNEASILRSNLFRVTYEAVKHRTQSFFNYCTHILKCRRRILGLLEPYLFLPQSPLFPRRPSTSQNLFLNSSSLLRLNLSMFLRLSYQISQCRFHHCIVRIILLLARISYLLMKRLTIIT